MEPLDVHERRGLLHAVNEHGDALRGVGIVRVELHADPVNADRVVHGALPAHPCSIDHVFIGQGKLEVVFRSRAVKCPRIRTTRPGDSAASRDGSAHIRFMVINDEFPCQFRMVRPQAGRLVRLRLVAGRERAIRVTRLGHPLLSPDAKPRAKAEFTHPGRSERRIAVGRRVRPGCPEFVEIRLALADIDPVRRTRDRASR